MSENKDPWTENSQTPREEDANWERKALRDIALEGVKERRVARRWGIFFKFLGLGYLFLILVIASDSLPGRSTDRGPHTALVDIQGVISEGAAANADRVVGGLRAAFKHPNTQGVIIRINSPGGSPVQAGYINDAVARLKAEYPDTPLYAVIADIGASGGYYVAVAADEIFADKASIVGSIGVRLDSFGFVDAMERLGIERRLFTAGENKAILDPFLPLADTDRDHMQNLLDAVHQQFIDTVVTSRGERLVTNGPELFSGLVWTGEQSLDLGLIDGLGSSSHVAREIIGAERIVNFTQRQDFFTRLTEGLGVVLLRLFQSQEFSGLR